jgi:hypothetical protein
MPSWTSPIPPSRNLQTRSSSEYPLVPLNAPPLHNPPHLCPHITLSNGPSLVPLGSRQGTWPQLYSQVHMFDSWVLVVFSVLDVRFWHCCFKKFLPQDWCAIHFYSINGLSIPWKVEEGYNVPCLIGIVSKLACIFWSSNWILWIFKVFRKLYNIYYNYF